MKTRFFNLFFCALLIPFFSVAQQEVLDSLKTALSVSQDNADKVTTLLNISRMSQERNEALAYAQQALGFAETDLQRSNSWNQVAWSQKNLFLFDSANYAIKKAEQYALQVGDKMVLSDIYNTYGSIYNNQNQYDSALYYHQQALKQREEAGDQEAQAVSMNNISIALEQLSRYDEAAGYINQSIEIYEALGLDRRMADSYLNRGNLLTNAGDLDGAYESYQGALKTYEALGLNVLMTYALINMGSVAIDLGDFEKGRQNYWQSLTILNANGQNANLMAYTLNGLGAIYLEHLVQPDSAIYYHEQGLKFAEMAGSKYLQSVSYHNLGTLYQAGDRHGDALSNLTQARDLKSEIGDQAGLSLVLAALGTTYGAQLQHARARESFSSAMVIAEEVGDLSNTEKIYRRMYEYAKSVGKYDEALDSFEKLSVLRDSLLNAEHLGNIAELNIAYDTDKKEQQIALQSAEIEGQDARLQRNQALIIGLILVAVLLIVIMTLLRNRAQKEQVLIRKEGELKLREAEINAVIGSQEKERNRFAKDLHDGFGQMISVLKMNLGQLGNGASKAPEKQLEVFEQSEQVIADMYAELRNICFDLMPQTLVQQGLPDALREFGQRINTAGTKVIEVLVFDLDDRLNELMEVSLYRISQEWVNNVLKYSEADHITLQLTRDETEITLTIEDNGTGFDPQNFFNGKGNGWRNIQSRVNLIKGAFELDSRPGIKGSLVSVNAPINLKEAIPTSTDEEIAARADF